MSRLMTLLGALGATFSAIAGATQLINPRWAAVLTVAGLALTTFNERLQGGASKVQGNQGEVK